jgi:hypothetical protein
MRRGSAAAVGAIVVIFLALIVVCVAIDMSTQAVHEITVEHKYMFSETEVSSDSDGDVSSTTTRHFVIVDSDGVTWKVGYPLWMLFRSRMVLYGKLEVGETYVVRTVGLRVEWLGEFPRIMSIEMDWHS